jgi:rare lipoprotein A
VSAATICAILLAFLVISACAIIPHVKSAPGPTHVLRGKASWYGEELRGSLMANGKPFNPDHATCATWHWPLGTTLKVETHNRAVIVLVTDRGPSRRFPERIVDLSRSSFALLADPDVGLIDVMVTPLR